jgi:hypothetical protein
MAARKLTADAKASTFLREDEGTLLAGAGMLKLAGDDTETHYWR